MAAQTRSANLTLVADNIAHNGSTNESGSTPVPTSRRGRPGRSDGGEPIAFRAPAKLLRGYEAIFDRGAFPEFETKSDMYRHGLELGFAALEGEEAKRASNPSPNLAQTIAAMKEVVAAQQHMEAFQEQIDLASASVRYIEQTFRSQRRAAQEVVTVLSALRKQIDDMAPGPWRAEYRQVWRERFGHIYTEARKTVVSSIVVLSEPDDEAPPQQEEQSEQHQETSD